MSLVDLKELSQRESERVEWKKNVAEIEDVVRTAVAFANDYSNLGGGYIVCGAEETKDESGFSKVIMHGLTSERCKEVEGKVLAHCRDRVDPAIVPLVEEIRREDETKRILVFIVPSSRAAHSYKPRGADAQKYFVRVGRETNEARNGLLRELLTRKGVLEHFDRRANPSVGSEDIDYIVLREYLQEMSLWDPKKPIEEYLSSDSSLSPLAPTLSEKVPLTGVDQPRNFTLLLFGKVPTKFMSGAYAIFSSYPGKDRSVPRAEKREIMGDIISQAKKLIEMADAESYVAYDKDDETPNQIKYPQKALQEALVNAIVHRDYESDKPVRVTVFSDRVEILSPGPLPRAVDKEKFLEGRASPFWRNQSLAYFFNKMQLSQAEGQGIPTILREMESEGCPEPKFEFEEESVICILPAHPRHEKLKQLKSIENSIIIGNFTEAFTELDRILSKDPNNFRAIDLLCEAAILADTPKIVLTFIHDKEPDLQVLNPATKIMMAETLLRLEDDELAGETADALIGSASRERMESREIRKVAIALRKLGKNEKAVELISSEMGRRNAFDNDAPLLDIRAKAKIDLAKKCMETARKRIPVQARQGASSIKAKAWEQARKYLAEAEADVRKALDHVVHSIDRDYYERDLEYLLMLKEQAKKPRRRKK